ncbi:bifunctional diguanylate cyclase/phosphodiesterase [Bradyrhizobium sp.]
MGFTGILRVSIVTRIFALMASTLLMVASGMLFSGLQLRQNRLEELRHDTKQLARIAELDMVRILEGAHQLLATLAKLPMDKGWDARACAVVAATANSDFEYDHIVTVDRNGARQCTSSGSDVVRTGTLMPDRELFDLIVATAGFSIGAYGVGKVSGNEVLRVGYPILDDTGAVAGAVYAGINLTWLNTAIDQWHLGAKTAIYITDRNGIQIARQPDSRGVGQPIPDNLKPFLSAKESGTVEVTDPSGAVNLFGYIPVGAGPSDGIAVFVGRDKRQIISDINQSIWLNVAAVLAGLLLSVILTLFYVRRFLARPFQNLLTVAGRWQKGDWSARAASASGSPEFDRLAAAFDGMAAEVSRRELEISWLARHDVLTGLANRTVFAEALQREIARAHRDGTNFAVLYLDLDHFKDINDTLGHPIGDLLLQSVAERLRANVRETDTVSRFGGDEFALIATELKQPGDAATLAEKVLAMMSEPVSLRDMEVRSGATIGIAVYGPESADAEALLSHADIALYRAKSEGRGTYRFFTEAMDIEVRTEFMLGAELRDAIASNQFYLVYQPQVEIHTGRITGVEALVRWRHPTRGIVSPGQFIPIAEKSGLIVALGRWVMHESCRQMREWLDAGVAPSLIGVNLSARQFKAPHELENDIAAILQETGVPPQRVELELTESVLMDASREHGDVLLRLRRAGFRIAIDDFGTGYSSLDYLRRYPVDRIKIAQQFMIDPAEGSGDTILRAAIALARELKLEVIVEGVETAKQLQRVKSCGGRDVQGYYFSKPVGAQAMTALLRKGSFRPVLPAVLLEALAG